MFCQTGIFPDLEWNLKLCELKFTHWTIFSHFGPMHRCRSTLRGATQRPRLPWPNWSLRNRQGSYLASYAVHSALCLSVRILCQNSKVAQFVHCIFFSFCTECLHFQNFDPPTSGLMSCLNITRKNSEVAVLYEYGWENYVKTWEKQKFHLKSVNIWNLRV